MKISPEYYGLIGIVVGGVVMATVGFYFTERGRRARNKSKPDSTASTH